MPRTSRLVWPQSACERAEAGSPHPEGPICGTREPGLCAGGEGPQRSAGQANDGQTTRSEPSRGSTGRWAGDRLRVK